MEFGAKLRLFAIFAALFLASAGVSSAQELFPLQQVPGGSGGGCLPGSICPGGYTWTLVYHDEFTGNGSPGTFTGDGLNWAVEDNNAASKSCATVADNTWCEDYPDGTTNGSYTTTPGAVIDDCQHLMFVGGGYLHIISTGAGTGTACEINQFVQLSPLSSTGGTFFEIDADYDNAGQWPDLLWFCCNNRPGGSGTVELDISEFGYKAEYFGNPFNFVVHDGYPGPGTGFHLNGIQFEATRGFRYFWDGNVVPDIENQFPHDADGFYNPEGCSVSTPCNQGTLIRFGDQNKSTSNSTGLLAAHFREYAHP